MYCPKCGHKQATTDNRFCSGCGIALAMATDLVAGGGQHLQREKREQTGISYTIATVIVLFSFLVIFGLLTLPQVPNFTPIFWVWLSFVITSLIIGGIGLSQLVRGGFFKRLKQRELQLKLMQDVEERQGVAEPVGETRELPSGSADYLSVTETTTRNLEKERIQRP